MPERGEEKGQVVDHTTHSGDLGKRLATRREPLGLTVSRLLRASMATTYLAYIEEKPAIVGQVCLVRLAAAALGRD